ncbi:MAG: carbohydrate ABC transporter permease [Bacillota bacterium]
MNIIEKALIYILLIAIAIFLIFPFFWLLSTSLKGPQETIFPSPPQWIPESPTLENYRVVFEKVNVVRSFLNSVIITFLGMFFNVITAALAAYPLARIDFRGRKIIFGMILATLMIPMQGTMIANYLTLKQLGLIDQYLGVVITTAVFVIGIVVLKAAYEAIPIEIEEAARVDGCGEFKIWFRVMLPMIKPALAAISILSFVYYWNDFMWPLIVLKTFDKVPLQVALSRLEGIFQTNFRYVTAGAVISMLPILIFFCFTQRYFIEGTKGAIKG